MSIFKSLKTAKRRGVETLMQALGASEGAVDEEFKEFEQMLRILSDDTNEIGAALSEYLTSQKQHVAVASELGTVMQRLYQSESVLNQGMHGMDLHQVSVLLQGLWSDIHGNYRPSAAKVLKDFAIDPLRQCVTVSIPEVEQLCSERDQLGKDVGSYRRRLAKLDKPNLTEVEVAEKNKLEAKLQVAAGNFDSANQRSKQEIARLKVVRDSMVELSIVYLAVCQADFYERSAARFKEMLATLPQDRVQHARSQINNYVRQGGPPRQEAEVSNVQKAWMVASGKALPSDFQKTEEQQEQDVMEAAKARERAVQIVSEDIRSSQTPNPPRGSPPARAPASQFTPSPPPRATATAKSKPAPARTPAPAPAPAPTASSPSSVLRRWNHNAAPATKPSAVQPPSSNGSVARKWPPHQSNSTSSTPSTPSSPSARRAPPAAPAAPAAPVQPPTPTQPASPPPPPKARKRVKALYTNEPDDADELGFELGEIIEVLEEIDDGWWKGRCHGKEGIFPTNYVEVLPS